MNSETNILNAEFWSSVVDYAWHEDLISILVVIILFSLIIFRVRPDERRIVRTSIVILLLTFAGLLLSGFLQESGYTDAAKLVHKLFIIIQGVIAIRLTALLLFRTLLPAVKVAVPSILEDIIVFVAYVIWGLLQLRYAGLEPGELVTASAVITAVIAFSMQDTLGNLLGGVSLQWDQSLKCGDWIRVNDIIGVVVDIRWRAVFIQTTNWETVVLPNSVLMKNTFEVLGRRINEPIQWRRWIWFNVDYSVAPARVVEIVGTAIREADIPNVCNNPQPHCLMMDYEPSFGRYAVRYWLADISQDVPTDSLVRQHIFSAMERAGITPALSKQHIYLTKEDEQYEMLQHERDIEHRISMLKKIDLFKSFTEEEFRQVADELKFSPFSKGDTITRQGDVDQWLYIVISGNAGANYNDNEGHNRRVFGFEHGDIFGEMGLMTGEARATSVIAESEMTCYRLDKNGFASVVHSRPGIIEEISHILVERKRKLKEAVDEILSEHENLNHTHFHLMSTIKHFFGIKEHE